VFLDNVLSRESRIVAVGELTGLLHEQHRGFRKCERRAGPL